MSLTFRTESLCAVQREVSDFTENIPRHYSICFHELMLIYIKLLSRNKIQVITTLVKDRNDCE